MIPQNLFMEASASPGAAQLSALGDVIAITDRDMLNCNYDLETVV